VYSWFFYISVCVWVCVCVHVIINICNAECWWFVQFNSNRIRVLVWGKPSRWSRINWERPRSSTGGARRGVGCEEGVCAPPQNFLFEFRSQIFVCLHINFWSVLRRCIFSATDCISAVQGHPRSMILVPIESAYVTSYKSAIVNIFLQRHRAVSLPQHAFPDKFLLVFVCRLQWIICQKVKY